jgi:hypothetical protein
VSQVNEDQLQVPTQLLREHARVVDAGPNHEARLAVPLDPVAETGSFHFHRARVECRVLLGHEPFPRSIGK